MSNLKPEPGATPISGSPPVNPGANSAQEPAQTQPEPSSVPQAQEPIASQEPKPPYKAGYVPLPAHLEERRKRQEAQAKIQELEKKMAEMTGSAPGPVPLFPPHNPLQQATPIFPPTPPAPQPDLYQFFGLDPNEPDSREFVGRAQLLQNQMGTNFMQQLGQVSRKYDELAQQFTQDRQLREAQVQHTTMMEGIDRIHNQMRREFDLEKHPLGKAIEEMTQAQLQGFLLQYGPETSMDQRLIDLENAVRQHTKLNKEFLEQSLQKDRQAYLEKLKQAGNAGPFLQQMPGNPAPVEVDHDLNDAQKGRISWTEYRRRIADKIRNKPLIPGGT